MIIMWTDTHCHLDAPEFNGVNDQVIQQAITVGVTKMVIPAVAVPHFSAIHALVNQYPECVYALGIHPLFVDRAHDNDLDILKAEIEQSLSDNRFVAIGEIGLDYFVPALKEPPLRGKQEYFYQEQLKLARAYDLPVLLHVRRSQDIILKYLRRIHVVGGIAHAFNGSDQQANTFVELGFKCGFGGAMTFPRSLQIRRLAQSLPIASIVLETDAPDIAPAWLQDTLNTPMQIPRIGQELANIRNMPVEDIMRITTQNAYDVMPRLALSSQ